MDQASNPEREVLLAQLQALAGSPQSAAALPFGNFLRHYYGMASADALRQRTPEELLAAARGHWQFAQRRLPAQALVRVLPSDGEPGGRAAFACVETCTADMPFLVDSVAMAVRDAGVSIDWTVHPILRVRRDVAGVLLDANAADDASGDVESPRRAGSPESLIHLEFEPLADAAAYAALAQKLRVVLGEVATVVRDHAAMRAQATALAERLAQMPTLDAVAGETGEARAFLLWLEAGHFTFLGYSETVAEISGGRTQFVPQTGSALGLLREGGRFKDADELIAPAGELDKYADSTRVVVVTKASQKSPVHHDEFMDVISVKRQRTDGSTEGTCRFIGLFSSEAYMERPRNIPLIRRKVEHVIERARLPEASHAGKALREILHGLPRDELFQSSEEELFQICMGIGALRERHQLKLFMRRDRYGRFYSCLVYLPRDRYSRELRDRIAQELTAICGGLSVERNVELPRGPLARIHYILRTPPGTRIAQSAQEVEQRLIAATRSWREQLREILLQSSAQAVPARIVARFADTFPLSYTESVPPSQAVADLQVLTQLSAQQRLLARLLLNDAGHAEGLKLYAWASPPALSDVLPALENFGLRVIRQEPTRVTPRDSEALWIQHFEIDEGLVGGVLSAAAQKIRFEQAFLQCWNGETENDGLNRLVLAAGLDARQVTCVRMITKYLIQTGLPYSQSYMEQLLAEHADMARLLVQLFETRFDPRRADAQRSVDEQVCIGKLDSALDQIASLDGDRVLRAFLSVVRAGLRTNYFQSTPQGGRKTYVSLKLDPAKVPELPLPRPMFEVFVYAPEVEGIHLRGGKVARGGLRWSDRRQDFRTEVLGLMKAQQVKNTVIVPVGAKGGFVVKKPFDAGNREAWMQQGIACYRTFVRGLLDITDNRVGAAVVVPPDVVRHDGDDPYLVVAADKGTATFSDIANGVAAEYGFWLGDAFASGGSAGYDHKKMGITARGAWESVKRHFRELEWADGAGVVRKGKDIQSELFSVVGIGDMSGDVFGNGMLLTRKIRLLAAFDHRHIFLDPDPDPEKSFVERERMFHLPRSSWADYDARLISAGGGVYPRSAKSIPLSDEVRKALDLRDAALTPAELIRAILRAPVDLLWNGGIGTYVKSAYQSHQDVGDRANDAVRVNGRELRCKVVGEGGNLGFTQLGRIEYALAGGRINTDAIDNAAGVHTSDREVNIKIPLNALMAAGRLDRAQRDPLLESMTADIAQFVLRDNYVQSQAISMLEQGAATRLDEHAELIRTLERDGLLNRQIEFLPDDDSIKERRTQSRGLTRPELSVLLAYSKISLYDAMLRSEVPEDLFFEHDLLANFPRQLADRFRDALIHHQLRREIIATMLTNAVVNRMGVSFSHRLADDHGVSRAEIIKAYAAAHRIYGGDRYWLPIEALDGRLPAALQYRLFERAAGLLKHATGWIVNSRNVLRPILENVRRFEQSVAQLEQLLPEKLPLSYREDWDRAVVAMRKEGVPEQLAQSLANTKVLGSALDIVELSESIDVSLAQAAEVYFGIGERFRMPWLYAAIVNLQVGKRWQALARTNLRDDAYRLQRLVAARVLLRPGATAAARLQDWLTLNERRVGFALDRVRELQTSGSVDFPGLVVAVRELRKLRAL